MTLSELAPAKINLFLHVGRPGADGYHDLASLMVFADLGDRVSLEPGGSGFALTGPFAAGLEGEGDNLVTRARDLFLERIRRRRVARSASPWTRPCRSPPAWAAGPPTPRRP